MSLFWLLFLHLCLSITKPSCRSFLLFVKSFRVDLHELSQDRECCVVGSVELLIASVSPFSPRYLSTFVAFFVLLCFN